MQRPAKKDEDGAAARSAWLGAVLVYGGGPLLAILLVVPEAPSLAYALARRADASVFGPAQPAADDAERFWAEVTSARRALSASVSRRRRVLGALSLRTFWHR